MDSLYSARALFLDETARCRAGAAARRAIDRLARTFRIVSVGAQDATVPNDGEAITAFARLHAIELYASWFIGDPPPLGFAGALPGDTTHRVSESLRAVERAERGSRIIVDSVRLMEFVARQRERGRRIVFTNGIFDLLHMGHLRLLERARQLGDVLIVAINSDNSARRIKGESRPVVPQFARAETLVSLRAVDCCCIFTETDPRRVLAIVRPGVLVKGGDYPRNRVVGARFVAAYGGRVVLLPLVEGLSTTSTIRRIHSAGENMPL